MFTFGYKTKFSSLVRALGAIGVGLVLIFGNNAPTTVVKIIAGLLVVAGLVSLVYGVRKNKEQGMYQVLVINACLDILLGLLLFFNPQWIAGIIVYLIGIALILFGALQLLALAGTLSMLGSGFSSLILSICAIVGGAFLLFNPLTIKVMSVIAGLFMILYGVSEIISTYKIGKAKKEYEIRFGPKPEEAPGTPAGQIDTSGIGDAKEVEFEKVDEPGE